MPTKTVTLFEVRYYPSQTAYSNTVGYKGRLVTRPLATKIIRRLKKYGVKAFTAKFKVDAKSATGNR